MKERLVCISYRTILETYVHLLNFTPFSQKSLNKGSISSHIRIEMARNDSETRLQNCCLEILIIVFKVTELTLMDSAPS